MAEIGILHRECVLIEGLYADMVAMVAQQENLEWAKVVLEVFVCTHTWWIADSVPRSRVLHVRNTSISLHILLANGFLPQNSKLEAKFYILYHFAITDQPAKYTFLT